jgi:acetylornithine deacetylase
LIEGGQEFSSYPARCLLTGERRTLPGETVADVERELGELLGRAAPDADLRLLVSREPFEISPEEEIVRLVVEQSGGQLVGVPFWTDAALLAGAGIPTVLYGPAGEGAHAAVEWVDLPSVERVRNVLVEVARAFCAVPS